MLIVSTSVLLVAGKKFAAWLQTHCLTWWCWNPTVTGSPDASQDLDGSFLTASTCTRAAATIPRAAGSGCAVVAVREPPLLTTEEGHEEVPHSTSLWRPCCPCSSSATPTRPASWERPSCHWGLSWILITATMGLNITTSQCKRLTFLCMYCLTTLPCASPLTPLVTMCHFTPFRIKLLRVLPSFHSSSLPCRPLYVLPGYSTLCHYVFRCHTDNSPYGPLVMLHQAAEPDLHCRPSLPSRAINDPIFFRKIVEIPQNEEPKPGMNMWPYK